MTACDADSPVATHTDSIVRPIGANAVVAKQRRAPDELADKRDRQLARLILRTASPVNRRNVADPLVRCSYLQMAKAVASSIGSSHVLDAYCSSEELMAALLFDRQRWMMAVEPASGEQHGQLLLAASALLPLQQVHRLQARIERVDRGRDCRDGQ
jgi:hypothetical protein